MVLKPDQERVCKMLKDTITLLCKNGLNFKRKFNIEAVIGVTLDDDDMFHISMSELVKSPMDEQDSDSSCNSEQSEKANGKHKRKRKKNSSIKTENNQSEYSEDDENGAEGSESDGAGSTNPAKRPTIKGEPEDEDDNSGDIVFVKQEMDENWSASCSQGASNFQNFSNMSTSSQQQQDHNFSSLSDMNLTPVTSTNDNNLWMQQIPEQYSTPRMQRTPSATFTGQPGESPMQNVDQLLQQSQVTAEQGGSGCEFCGKIYFNKPNLLRHQQSVHLGIYPYKCDVCGKGFANKDNLNGHVFLHTGVMAYKCTICNDEFQYKSTLERHTKREHKLKLTDESMDTNLDSSLFTVLEK